MPKTTGAVVAYPARASFVWYVALIAAGASLLMLPICCQESASAIGWLDAVFTATSAACVTGLSVRSTGNDFSPVGQIVILLLIQLGGIGIMTVTTLITFRLGGGSDLRQRAVLAETLGAHSEPDLGWVLRNVILLTLIFEAIGFVILAARNLLIDPPGRAIWHALFHSVSAFCNAGFSLNDDSLTRYQGDPVVNFTIAGLVITGGLGFPVLLDIKRNWHGPLPKRWERLCLHSKIMLIGTVALLVFGTLVILTLEWDGVLGDYSLGKKLLVCFFHSMSCRTAGFNTIELGSLTNASLFVSILLMAIGAGPCSTAGGIKVSTLMALMLNAFSTLRGEPKIQLLRRTVSATVVTRATSTLLLFSVIAVLALTLLLVVEQSSITHVDSKSEFLDAMFEVFSALGTVGLSTGLTPRLTDVGRCIIIVLMFMGRLGPISVFVALSRVERTRKIEFPHEDLLIG
ncbi:MAG: TrkH family potassium uptake protein [Planctomycetota bacterium]